MDTYLGALRTKLAAPSIMSANGKYNPMAQLMQLLGGGRFAADQKFGGAIAQWAKAHPGWAIGSGLFGLQALRPVLSGLPIVGPMVGGNQR